MRKNCIIQRLLAAFLLLLFAFSITPRKYLHDALANHKDSFASGRDDSGLVKLHKAAVNCHTESIVAESPFANDAGFIQVLIPVFFSAGQSSLLPFLPAAPPLLSRLRGPPSFG